MASNRSGSEPQATKVLQIHHTSSNSTVRPVAKIPAILPHERVFPIQIGSELFKLSGASLSSDGKSAAMVLSAELTSASTVILFAVLSVPDQERRGKWRVSRYGHPYAVH